MTLLDLLIAPAHAQAAPSAGGGGMTGADHRAARGEGRIMHGRLIEPAGRTWADLRSGPLSFTLPMTTPVPSRMWLELRVA